MKLKALLFAVTVFFISCSNDKKTTELPKQASTLKSDVLLQNSAVSPFSNSNENDTTYLTLSGTSLLKSTVTLKTVSSKGEELDCETFPASRLVKPEYKTANSALKEAHLREVVSYYFIDKEVIKPTKNTIAGI